MKPRMRVYEMPYGEDREDMYPEDRRRRSDGTYMGYDRVRPRILYPRDERRYHEDERRYQEERRRYREPGRERAMYPGFVPPYDHYGNEDDEYYEGDFRIVRGRDY